MWGMHRDMHGGGSQAAQTPVVSAASQMTVEIHDFDFFPRELTVKTGTAVTWVNRDAAPHDATVEAGGVGHRHTEPGGERNSHLRFPRGLPVPLHHPPQHEGDPDGGVARQSLTACCRWPRS